MGTRKIEDLGPGDHQRLYFAALGGDLWVARELEALGISDEEESLNDARGLSEIILETVESARVAAVEREALVDLWLMYEADPHYARGRIPSVLELERNLRDIVDDAGDPMHPERRRELAAKIREGLVRRREEKEGRDGGA